MNRRKINVIRDELNAVKAHPDTHLVYLPPQPSILPPLPRESFIIRGAKKFDDFTNNLGRLRPTLAHLAHFQVKKSFNSLPVNQVSRVVFKKHSNPKVSIIIPVFNKFELTIECLASIQDFISSKVSYEVIIVDNNSTDKSHYLNRIDGLVYIRNTQNEGFVGGCNIGAASARGEFIVFLNNDALVTTNWLENLLRTLEGSDNVGLVGSKILYPDGRLQEAGGIIFKDGSGWNYGKNDHPDRYQFNYVREVDYCSGASIIISKKLFDSFYGFDKLYSPAYYEDTDLAFKVRKAGLKVLYQPESVIYHIEGATAGVSTNSGFKKYQEINRVKFLRRWNKTLKSEHKTQKELYLARDRSHDKMALIVDEFVPMPDKDSGSVRMVRMIELLQELGYKVTFFPNHLVKNEGYTQKLQQKGVEVVYGPIHFNSFIEENGKWYDVVILSRPRIGSYFMEACQIYCQKAKIIYDTVDLHFLRLGRQAKFEKGKLNKYYRDMSIKHEILEKDIITNADTAMVVSEIEASLLKKAGFKNVEILSNIHDVDDAAYHSGFNDRKDMLFIGGYSHLPNIDGVEWFVNEILPIVLRKIPNAKLHVVGSNMPTDLEKYLRGKRGVIVDGFIEDISPILSSARVFIAPLRYGAGVKGKVGQAVEYGIPVVSTTIGAEGMYMSDGESVCIADTPDEFARKVISLYTDESLWDKIHNNARIVLTNHFSRDAAKKNLQSILKT